jgi:hypothetical protein
MFKVEIRARVELRGDRVMLVPSGDADWLCRYDDHYASRASALKIAELYGRDGYLARVVEEPEPPFVDEY